MNEGPKAPTLASVADGAAEALFADALTKVLENIDDLNTEAKAPRTITLTITIRPDERRQSGVVSVGCKTKMPTTKPVTNTVFMGRHLGKLAVVEAMPQEDMFTEPHGKPRAVEGVGL